MADIHHDRHGNAQPEAITTNEARAGTGGQQTSYVMVASTLGAAIAMAVVLIYLWNSWG